jgi:Holliday junction resolvase RusA-like endonuclease
MNSMYTLVRNRGVPRLIKSEGVEAYQLVASHAARRAKPSGWEPTHPKGLLRINYWFFMARNIDSDNALKALNDAIAKGIGYDDKYFLPCVVSKEWGTKEPRVVVQISDFELSLLAPDPLTLP